MAYSSSADTTRAIESSTRCAAHGPQSARARQLEAENARLRSELTASDVGRRIDRESYKQVQRSVGDMQSQIARLTQDLSFYRGLVQPDSLVHVKVQQMQIVPETPGRFQIKFVLMQTGKPDNNVAGYALDRDRGLDRRASRRPSNSPMFRSIGAPAWHTPSGTSRTTTRPCNCRRRSSRLASTVELFTAKDSTHGFRQAFVWKAQGMSVETEANGEASKEKSDVQTETE
jgi:hypothetical protein